MNVYVVYEVVTITRVHHIHADNEEQAVEKIIANKPTPITSIESDKQVNVMEML